MNNQEKSLPVPSSSDSDARQQAVVAARTLLVAEGVDAYLSGGDIALAGDVRGWPEQQMVVTYSIHGHWMATFGGQYYWPVETVSDVVDVLEILARSAR